MELHEEIRRARKELDLSQAQLAALVGIQRRQLSILERGGNVTLNTLRRVLAFLPNLEEFTFEQIRMKPTYIDLPPLEWSKFYVAMHNLNSVLEELSTLLKSYMADPPTRDDDPAVEAQRTEELAKKMMDIVNAKLKTEPDKKE